MKPTFHKIHAVELSSLTQKAECWDAVVAMLRGNNPCCIDLDGQATVRSEIEKELQRLIECEHLVRDLLVARKDETQKLWGKGRLARAHMFGVREASDEIGGGP